MRDWLSYWWRTIWSIFVILIVMVGLYFAEWVGTVLH